MFSSLGWQRELLTCSAGPLHLWDLGFTPSPHLTGSPSCEDHSPLGGKRGLRGTCFSLCHFGPGQVLARAWQLAIGKPLSSPSPSSGGGLGGGGERGSRWDAYPKFCHQDVGDAAEHRYKVKDVPGVAEVVLERGPATQDRPSEGWAPSFPRGAGHTAPDSAGTRCPRDPLCPELPSLRLPLSQLAWPHKGPWGLAPGSLWILGKCYGMARVFPEPARCFPEHSPGQV